jgi:hypothetical protein
LRGFSCGGGVFWGIHPRRLLRNIAPPFYNSAT